MILRFERYRNYTKGSTDTYSARNRELDGALCGHGYLLPDRGLHVGPNDALAGDEGFRVHSFVVPRRRRAGTAAPLVAVAKALSDRHPCCASYSRRLCVDDALELNAKGPLRRHIALIKF